MARRRYIRRGASKADGGASDVYKRQAVAYAAVRLGWIEYFNQQYGIAVPQAAQEALEASQRCV